MRGRFAATDAGRGIEPDTKRTVERGSSTAGPTKLERELHGTISSGNSMRTVSSLELNITSLVNYT